MPLRRLPSLLKLLTLGLLLFCFTGCALPRVNAEDRLFLDLSLDFLGAYELPVDTFENTTVGGLSGIAYDRQRDRLYAVSDDRSSINPARFYTLKLDIGADEAGQPRFNGVEITGVTTLKDQTGATYSPNSLDPEGIALSPRQSVFIASEGVARDGVSPFIQEFDLTTGQYKGSLQIPERYTPKTVDDQPQGIQDNLGFEGLTLNPGGYSPTWLEPFRLFAANESALLQDIAEPDPDSTEPQPTRSRFLHYLVGDERSTLISEHLYLVEPLPEGAIANGLTEILTLDQAGHFLSIERSYGIGGLNAKIFQLATGGATDISGISTLSGDVEGIQPIRKQLLLDLSTLDIPLDNLEGLTLGPQLPDGTRSLIVASDNNFNDDQITQFLLFRLRGLQEG
ncbi:esterase-like activity of phytase family protein [Oscillatoria sp. FACHB-1407]|uniref:esterase-like activity of phytase family protein n=1 Tax=Oscillatoria sp. FACHB-1407 TaxID=2692847 RepID=UPI0016867357|nr:esterase-like activity of phytase family protein [Oscillatoria sp. FACHB-1407]MBD2462219.1 esterase-like activity of phytase family protein [Oscillatoria sp. FACHB-1407]